MVDVTENYPGAFPTFAQKQEEVAVPSGEEDKWLDAQDVNDRTGITSALGRAVRLNALVAAITSATEAINNKAVRFTGGFINGLPVATAALTTEPDRLFAAAMEKIEQGGDLDGTASGASGFFGVHDGIVSAASGTYSTGAFYGLSSDGSLVTYVSGSLPPIARGLNATTAYVDLSGRIRADGSTIKYDNSGKLVAIADGNHASSHQFGGADVIDGHLLNLDMPKDITVEAPTSSEKIPWFTSPRTRKIQLLELQAYVDGSSAPSMAWTVKFGLNPSQAGTEVVSGGTSTTGVSSVQTITSLDNAVVASNSAIWLETTDKSGTVDALKITTRYRGIV